MASFVFFLVDGSRKSVTHAVDLPSPQWSVAQTKKAEDVSMLPTGARKTITPQDTSKAAPSQSASEQEASVSQGREVKVLVKACKTTLKASYNCHFNVLGDIKAENIESLLR